MIIRAREFVDVPTPTGPMRTHLFRPVADGPFQGVLLFSEIYQVTAPIARLAACLAGHGLIVSVPEIYHEHEPAGTALAYDAAGTERGNALKYGKPIGAFDTDIRAGLDHLVSLAGCDGTLGAVGVCLGGHLALRAALQRDVAAAACFYPTDVHTASLGGGDDTLARAGEIGGRLLMVFGRADPHVPFEGRQRIRARLEAAGVVYGWHEVEAAHAFLRDEGPRYDPALAHFCQGLLVSHLRA